MEVVLVGCLGPGIQRPSGVSNYVGNILAEFPKIGIKVKLIGAGPEVAYGLPYRFVSLWPSNGRGSYGFLIRLFVSNPSFHLSPDSIINVHRPDDLIPFLLLRKKNPKVITLHGTHFRNVYLKRGRLVGKAYDFLERFSTKRVHQLISVSRTSRELFLKRYPELENSIHYIPPGVNTSIFRKLDRFESRTSLGFNEDDFLVLYAGRLEMEKRLDMLLKAFSHLKKERSNARLLIAGEGREKPRLESLVSSYNVGDVFMLGSVPQSEMPRLMSASDVFCLLSIHEGFPSVLLEALACGLPVVSTRVGDVPDLVQEGVNGSILGTSEPREIANTILKMGSLRDSMAPKCIKVASDYSWNKAAVSTAKVYLEALSNAT